MICMQGWSLARLVFQSFVDLMAVRPLSRLPPSFIALARGYWWLAIARGVSCIHQAVRKLLFTSWLTSLGGAAVLSFRLRRTPQSLCEGAAVALESIVRQATVRLTN